MKRLCFWIYAQTLEVGAFLLLLILYLASRMHLIRTKPIGSGKPILLVHGYCNHGSIWCFFQKKLSLLCSSKVYTIDLGYPFDSIEAYVEKVAGIVEKIRQEAKSSKLILVGHSMGGLICAYYALQRAPQASVAAVITIGSPLKGTKMAKIGVGQCARQMELHSPFTNDLCDSISRQKTVKFYHIATKTDELIIPQTSAWLEKSEGTYLLDGIGHASLVFSSRVVKKISEWINQLR